MNSNLALENQSLTLRVPGDLVSTNADAVRSDFAALLDSPGGARAAWTTFRLDLTGAKMVDSVGLNLVVGFLKRVQKRGARMQIIYSNQNVQRTLIFTRLDQHIELVQG